MILKCIGGGNMRTNLLEELAEFMQCFPYSVITLVASISNCSAIAHAILLRSVLSNYYLNFNLKRLYLPLLSG